jgi:undecaprenyl-diphosphatase
MEQFDKQLFLILNSANSPFWDNFMYFMSLRAVWIPLYLIVIFWLIRIYKRKFIILILFIILSVVMADQISGLIKDLTARPRPCHETSLQGLVHIVRGHCGGAFGFVSSHAANSFNVAALSIFLVRNRFFSVFIFLWAAIVSYSRIYLGVHYPGDVLCGALLGMLTGWIIYRLYMTYDAKKLQHGNPSPSVT